MRLISHSEHWRTN